LNRRYPITTSLGLAALLVLSGCQTWPTKTGESSASEPVQTDAVIPPPVIDAPASGSTGQPDPAGHPTPAIESVPATEPAPVTSPRATGSGTEIKTPPLAMDWLQPGTWNDLPGWKQDDRKTAWPAWLQSCSVLRRQTAWRTVCAEAARLQNPGPEQIRQYFVNRFQPYQLLQADNNSGHEGLVTGYYEPLLRGSRVVTPKYRFPLRSPPDDLLTIDLGGQYPELRGLRLRGRLDGNRVVPYFTRGEIEAGRTPLPGRELAWADDAVELFFLQVQGSGRLLLENGETLRIGYADQNGHPYRSIGKWLIERGELTLDKASMQGIKEWARRNPERLPELLAANPSYVFFRELANQDGGPIGSLGVPLTNERSIAVDPRSTPLGAPVWLATTRPNSSETLNRLMLAQDTGSAIKGQVRADFFWGFGDEAGRLAGAMKQKGRMWVLLPKTYPLTAVGSNNRSGL
jgi:membrane-bound lytic murein transglycosylase A